MLLSVLLCSFLGVVEIGVEEKEVEFTVVRVAELEIKIHLNSKYVKNFRYLISFWVL